MAFGCFFKYFSRQSCIFKYFPNLCEQHCPAEYMYICNDCKITARMGGSFTYTKHVFSVIKMAHKSICAPKLILIREYFKQSLNFRGFFCIMPMGSVAEWKNGS